MCRGNLIEFELIVFADISSLFAYTLDDGTVGVYNENIRLWRVKVRRIDANP